MLVLVMYSTVFLEKASVRNIMFLSSRLLRTMRTWFPSKKIILCWGKKYLKLSVQWSSILIRPTDSQTKQATTNTVSSLESVLVHHVQLYLGREKNTSRIVITVLQLCPYKMCQYRVLCKIGFLPWFCHLRLCKITASRIRYLSVTTHRLDRKKDSFQSSIAM